jgi:multidrug transporter EmrE-like cation transporter
MDESEKKKYGNKYVEIILMISNFLIAFVGLQIALKNYLETDYLRIRYTVLLFLISANILTWMILLLDEKRIWVKSLWTLLLLIAILLVNFFVR